MLHVVEISLLYIEGKLFLVLPLETRGMKHNINKINDKSFLHKLNQQLFNDLLHTVMNFTRVNIASLNKILNFPNEISELIPLSKDLPHDFVNPTVVCNLKQPISSSIFNHKKMYF